MVFCLNIQAKHLEFMGIPITGTITNFQSKLIAKGCTLLKGNSQLPVGTRLFKGVFTGKQCDICVYYNYKTNQVYKVGVVFDGNESLSDVHDDFDSLKDLLKKKYSGKTITSDMIDDIKFDRYEFELLVFEPPIDDDSEPIGVIRETIYDDDDYPKTYALALLYTDIENSEKNEQSTLEDL